MRQRTQKSRPGLEKLGGNHEAGKMRDGKCGLRRARRRRSGQKQKAPCITHGAGHYSLLVVSHSIETPRTREKITSSKSATRRLPVSIRLIAI